MASSFSFGGASSAAAASPFSFTAATAGPAFGTTTPAFGATASPSLFGAPAAAPAFGQQSAASLFGGATTPAFGAASTPVFGSTTPSPFGAPAAGLFGAPVASTGTVSLFGGAATQPAFGSAFGTPFGTPQQPQQPAGFGQQQPAVGYQAGQFSAAAASLVTTDGKPLSHATKWEEISAQGQAYLLELEKTVGQYRDESRNLEGCERLRGDSSRQLKQEMQEAARVLRQGLQYVENLLKEDTETVASFREKALKLLRGSEVAVLTFQRSHRWREACKAAPGQMLPPNMRERLNGPIVLPSAYLRHAVISLQEAMQQYQRLVIELEAVLPMRGAGGGYNAAAGVADPFQALPLALNNLHEFFTHVAARLEALHDAVATAKDLYLEQRRKEGDSSDPFAAAERREQQRKAAIKSRVTTIPPAAAGAVASAAPTPTLAPAPAPALGATASAPAPAGTGFFGSSASPFGATPAFGGLAAPAASPWGTIGGTDPASTAAAGSSARKGRKSGR